MYADQSVESTYNLPFRPGDQALDRDTVSLNASHPSTGYTEYDVHNLYGHTMAKAVHAYWDEMEMRPMSLIRSTFPGSGQYGQHILRTNIGPSWDDLKYAIAGIYNFNMFGIPVTGADICSAHHTDFVN